MIDTNYFAILNDLTIKIRQARQKAAITVNTALLELYWEIGNTISLQQKQQGWGAKVIQKLALDLKMEFPDFKGLSARNLHYMKSFAEAWPKNLILQPPVAKLQSNDNHDITILQPLVAKLPWAHHIVLLNKTQEGDNRLFYLQKSIENGWSKSVLARQIESQLHLRLGQAITNFDITLPKPFSDHARETLKNPYLFDFLGIGEEMQEQELERALVKHIKKFVLELGRGFAYVGNQYNLRVEDDDYFLDLLFYNYHLHCFVVFELKVTDFKPEYAGKLNFYINTVNEQIKGKKDQPTIGVLLCKTPNATVVRYSLQNINAPMGVAEYEFTNALPKQLKSGMPTIEELEQELQKEVTGFKEQDSPVNERLKNVKERLRAMNKEEVQLKATYAVLYKLYIECFKPLYIEIIKQLQVFEEDFYNRSFGWFKQLKNINSFEQLDALWKDEASVMQLRHFAFFHNLSGFRKAGTNSYDMYLLLKLEIHDYWYGFSFDSRPPFLKKLYHQPLNETETQTIVDAMMTQIMDGIEQFLVS